MGLPAFCCFCLFVLNPRGGMRSSWQLQANITLSSLGTHHSVLPLHFLIKFLNFCRFLVHLVSLSRTYIDPEGPYKPPQCLVLGGCVPPPQGDILSARGPGCIDLTACLQGQVKRRALTALKQRDALPITCSCCLIFTGLCLLSVL